MFGGNVDLPKGGKYINPGIQNVEITDIKSVSEGNAYIALYLKLVGADDADTKEFRLWINDERAFNTTQKKLVEIINAANPAASSITGSTAEEYVSKLKPMLVGRKYTQKFAGYQTKADGPFYPKIPASLRTQSNPAPTIACPIDSKINLPWDENNKWDMQKKEADEIGSDNGEAPAWPSS